MNNDDNAFISPGNLIALWRLVLLAQRYERVSISIAIKTIRDSGSLGGSIPAQQGLNLGVRCKLLVAKSNELYLTEYCQEAVVHLCDNDEPNIAVIRAILSRIINEYNYHWLIYFSEDVQTFKARIPRQWVDLLNSARLFQFEDEDVLSWWKVNLEKFHEYDERKKKEIGDIGEKLTIEHEKSRLARDGIDNPHHYVKWAARFGNSYGFDVLSIRGHLLKRVYNINDEIQIEVKASVTSNEKTFRFRVTKNEWNTAQEHINSYFFFCWTGVKIQDGTASSGPYIIPAKDIQSHFPDDSDSPICEWSECRLNVDLNEWALIQHF